MNMQNTTRTIYETFKAQNTREVRVKIDFYEDGKGFLDGEGITVIIKNKGKNITVETIKDIQN